MKLSYLALMMMVVLLAVMVWLAVDSHNQAVGYRNQLELYQRKEMATLQAPGQAGLDALQQRESQMMAQQATVSGHGPAVVRAPSTASPQYAGSSRVTPPSAPAVRKLPTTLAEAMTLPPAPSLQTPADLPLQMTTPSIPQASIPPPPMTQWEKKVISLPVLGKVSEYHKEYGFVVINAGADRKIENGQIFAIRRYNSLVGRIKVHDVDSTSAVGDLDSKSIPAGVTVEVGDEVVQDLPPEQ